MKPKSVVFQKIARTAEANPFLPQNIRVPKVNSKRAKVVGFLAKARQCQNSPKLNPYNWNLAQMSYWLTFHKTPPKTVTMNIVPEGIYFVDKFREPKNILKRLFEPVGGVPFRGHTAVKEPLLDGIIGSGFAEASEHEIGHLKFETKQSDYRKKWVEHKLVDFNTTVRELLDLKKEMTEDWLNIVAKSEIISRVGNPDELIGLRNQHLSYGHELWWKRTGKEGKLWLAYTKKYIDPEYQTPEFIKETDATTDEVKRFIFYLKNSSLSTRRELETFNKRMRRVTDSVIKAVNAGIDKIEIQKTIFQARKFDDIPKELKRLIGKE